MLGEVKKRCGIAESVTAYDDEIRGYIEDCESDLTASGVPLKLIENENQGVITAVTLYVKAFLGNDRADTEKYLKLYHRKVTRLTLEEEE